MGKACPVSSGYMATGTPVWDRKSRPPCRIPSDFCTDDNGDAGDGTVLSFIAVRAAMDNSEAVVVVVVVVIS